METKAYKVVMWSPNEKKAYKVVMWSSHHAGCRVFASIVRLVSVRYHLGQAWLQAAGGPRAKACQIPPTKIIKL